MNSEIRIPQGMRDLIGNDCEKKEILKQRIESIFISAGYRQIETPAVEFFNTFRNGYTDVKSEEMYRFFDQNGQMLVLREDMTVPIARVCASKFANAKPPFRIRYCSDVFKVRHAFAGKRNEVTDCGIELIGADESSDLEVVSTALDVMECLNADDWSLEIGNSRFFAGACEELNLNEEEERKLADLTDRKSMVDLEEYLNGLGIDEKQKAFFLRLPMLGGEKDVLDEADAVSFNDSLKKEVQKLRTLNEKLEALGYRNHVTFDFGKIPHLDYYTGIIFEGYISNVGTSVLSGGRYDRLLEKFGRNLPACGFSIKLDYLLDALNVQQSEEPWTLYYPPGSETEAILKARQIRKEHPVQLVARDSSEMEVVKE